MIWQAIGVMLLGASPAVGSAETYGQAVDPAQGAYAAQPGYDSGMMPGMYSGEYAGGMCEDGYGPCGWFGRPCFFDSYWDYTGGRSPSAYSCECGYGPDWCYTWQVRTEWLMWFSSPRSAPTLITTSPAGTLRADAGVLDDPDTRGLYRGEEIGDNMRNGARVTIGRMLADNMTGLTGRFWGVENGAEVFRVDSSDVGIIALPFFNVDQLVEDALLVSFPGVAAFGSAEVQSKNSLFGADAWLSRNVAHNPWVTIDLLAGYQFTRMDDSLDIRSAFTAIDIASPFGVGTQVTTRDSFRTQNEFHGGTIGILADFRKDVLSFEVLGKLALGNMRQQIIIEGQQTQTPIAGPVNTIGEGLYAQGTNSGRFERNKFLVVPELNANVVWHFTPQWTAVFGYSLLYLDSVVLAGDQIDRALNLSPLANPPRPQLNFNRNDFFVQGINLGVDFRW